jgi:hypothetical protein
LPDAGNPVGSIFRAGLDASNAVRGRRVLSYSRSYELQPLVQSSLLGWIFDGPNRQAL